MSGPARVLIVDDSAVMRSLLRSVISSDPHLEVAGTATDGASALLAVESLHPDLILLDVEMPVMDGLSTLRQMRTRGIRVPVIVCSSLTQRGARITIEALANGAADYVAKPSSQPSRESAVQALAQDLIPKILALIPGTAAVPDPRLSRGSVFPFNGPQPSITSQGAPVWPGPPRSIAPPAIPGGAPPAPTLPPASAAPPSVVLVGVSTGGPAALDVILPELPATFSVPILIVQHMPELFTRLLAERLNSRCALHVHEAVSGEPVYPGHVYIAQGGRHMELVPSPSAPSDIPAAIIRLTQDEPVNHCRPAVDILFRSAASIYGPRILAIVLTGMGYDGLAGSRLIRERGGSVLAQDQATSAVWGMPGAVAQAGLAQRLLPLNAIASEILRLTGRGQHEASELRESVVIQ